MTEVASIEFEVRSAAGVLIFTSPDRPLALRYARKARKVFPGLVVDRVIRTEARDRLYTAHDSERVAA